MKTLTNFEIKGLCDDHKRLKSLRKAAKKNNRSVATVKKYVSKKLAVKCQNIVRKLKIQDSRLIGFYVGLWMGDGSQYKEKKKDGYKRYIVKICCNKENKSLNLLIQNAIYRLFGKTTNLIEEKTLKELW
ncbi:hypothetical protein ISS07_06725 [Candidatus Woesearchaeota archaeon]|nr:hypothetical protein [Candidatus Woesearchaeota archaeon]